MRKIKVDTEQILRNLAKSVNFAILAYGGSESGPRGPPLSDSMETSTSWLINNVLRNLHARHKKISY